MSKKATLNIGARNRLPRVSPRWRKFAANITSGDMVLNQDFKEFIESLNENNVCHLVIGGNADVENPKRNKKATGRHQDLADMENL